MVVMPRGVALLPPILLLTIVAAASGAGGCQRAGARGVGAAADGGADADAAPADLLPDWSPPNLGETVPQGPRSATTTWTTTATAWWTTAASVCPALTRPATRGPPAWRASEAARWGSSTASARASSEAGGPARGRRRRRARRATGWTTTATARSTTAAPVDPARRGPATAARPGPPRLEPAPRGRGPAWPVLTAWAASGAPATATCAPSREVCDGWTTTATAPSTKRR